MKMISVGVLKNQFSKILRQLESGESITITYGKKKDPIAVLTPPASSKKPVRLGLLEGKVKFQFADDFKMTNEEFLGL